MRLELWSMRPCRAVVPWLSAIALARVVILSLTFVLSSFTHVETLMRLRPFLGVPTPAGHGYRVSPARLAREWRRGDQKKISPERLGQYASASHASVTRGPRPLIPPLPTAHRPNKKDFANESCQMGAAQAKCVGFRSSGCDSYRRGLGRYGGPSEDSFFCRLSAPTAPRLATTCHLFLDRIRTPGGYGVFCAEWIPNFHDRH